ncbi:hypothetical protein [Mesorhizobium sp. M0698]|uniref:hypothetical protein n=1 Tax=Mesorhizobium sp. M0698 TaxID=2956987 RepID=UPI003338D69B
MKNDVDWKTISRFSLGSESFVFCGGDRMFGAHDHGMISPLSVPQRVLRSALQVSCQMRKSFHNNDMALIAVCLMSDFVEDPTTSADVTA